MNHEVVMLRARIADKKKTLRSMQLKADSYLSMIREILDPYEGDFTALDLERASILMQDFLKLHKEGAEMKTQIARMEKDLNG